MFLKILLIKLTLYSLHCNIGYSILQKRIYVYIFFIHFKSQTLRWEERQGQEMYTDTDREVNYHNQGRYKHIKNQKNKTLRQTQVTHGKNQTLLHTLTLDNILNTSRTRVVWSNHRQTNIFFVRRKFSPTGKIRITKKQTRKLGKSGTCSDQNFFPENQMQLV